MTTSPKDIARYRQDTTTPAREVLEHIYNAVLAVPTFTLKDGTKAQLSRLRSPELNEDEEVTCSFDVDFEDGSRLEFTLKNTGWGRPCGTVGAPTTPRPARGCRCFRFSACDKRSYGCVAGRTTPPCP